MDLQRIVNMAASIQGPAFAAAEAARARVAFFEQTGFSGGRWDVVLADGAATAGETLRGHVRFEPDAPLAAVRLRSRLLGLELASYDRRVTRKTGESTEETQTDRLFQATDLGQFVAAIDFGVSPGPGAPIDLDFALPVPSWVPPSVSVRDSSGKGLYETRWLLEIAAVVNVDDPDPSACFRTPVALGQPPDASAGGLAAGALDMSCQSDGNPRCTIEVTPTPLVAGLPFTGRAQLAGFDAGKIRAVIEAVVETKEPSGLDQSAFSVNLGDVAFGGRPEVSVSGVQETIELWRGPISSGGGTLEFGGTAPLGSNVEGPNGKVTLRLGLVEDRRFMPDRNWRRPIAIAARPPKS